MRLDTAMQLLHDTAFFRGVPKAETAALRAFAHHKSLTPDRDLLSEGTNSGLVYIVVTGIMQVTVWSGKQEIALGLYGCGSVLGEVSAMQGCPHTATVTTLVRSDCLVWSAEEFRSCIMRSPRLSYNLSLLSQRRLRRRTEQVTAMATQNLSSRLAQQLLFLAEDHGRITDGGTVEFSLRLTQQMLANLIGASRESVCRELAFLQEQKILSFGRAKPLVINDLTTLQKRCQS